MKRKTVIITMAVLAVIIIGVFAILRMQTKADTVPVMSDNAEIVQNDVVEETAQETEQAPPVTDEEPEQTGEAAPITPEQDDTEPEETDVAQEETETEPIDKALTDVTELDKIMYATSAVNTRSGPSTEFERVGGLTTNDAVHVTGQSNLTSWYRIDIDGVTQFVSNNYLADAKAEVQQSANNSTETSTNTGEGTNETTRDNWTPNYSADSPTDPNYANSLFGNPENTQYTPSDSGAGSGLTAH